MVIKTKKHTNFTKTKKHKKTIKRKKQGGKKKIDWEKGEWSEEPIIHAKFITKENNKTECGYSLLWNYYYLDEPLEKENKLKKIAVLQIFTNSAATDRIKNVKEKDQENNQLYRNCDLSEKEVLELLEKNPHFQKEVAKGKRQIEEMVEMDRKQKILIQQLLQHKRDSANETSDSIIGKNKEIKDIFSKKKK